jgi:hypothetical protein
MVNGLHIHIQNRTRKPLAFHLSGVWRGLRRGYGGGNLTNVQCKPIQNCCKDSSLYNEYILRKMINDFQENSNKQINKTKKSIQELNKKFNNLKEKFIKEIEILKKNG